MTFSRVCTGLGHKMELYGSRMMLGSVYGVGGSFVTFSAALGSGLESLMGAEYIAAALFGTSAAVGGTGFVIRGTGKILFNAPASIKKISQERFKQS